MKISIKITQAEFDSQRKKFKFPDWQSKALAQMLSNNLRLWETLPRRCEALAWVIQSQLVWLKAALISRKRLP